MIAYIGLGIAALGFVAGIGFMLVGVVQVTDPLSDRTIDRHSDHPSIPWRVSSRKILLGLAIFFVIGTGGFVMFIGNL